MRDKFAGCGVAAEQEQNKAELASSGAGGTSPPLSNEQPAKEMYIAEEGHPERICQDCGGLNAMWFAPNDLWNRVIPERSGIVCPVCFIRRAGNAGIDCSGWELKPDNYVAPRWSTEEIAQRFYTLYWGEYTPLRTTNQSELNRWRHIAESAIQLLA